VQLKIVSGDEPRTLAAIARAVGIDEAAVAGRVSPGDKRAMIAALQAEGHTVGMIGDGVNDVLALKQADVGIAMATGSPAARSAAQIILVDSDFARLPAIVAEGRRVAGNVERVAKLFVTKTVYACLLAIAVGVARLPFPFFPRHLTLVSSLTIGVPALVLALAPSSARAQPGFIRRVLVMAMPLGAIAAAATFAGYALAREDGLPTAEARTVATLVLFGVGLCVLAIIARPLTRGRRALIAAMAAGFAVVLAMPAGRTLFALDLPRPLVAIAVVGLVAIAGGLMEAGRRVVSTRLGTFDPVPRGRPSE
jgi:magnesium-transporting ATPase (P-type)